MEYGTIMLADGSTREVSRLILGTARFGSSLSEEVSFQLMDRYFEAGGNALDTARVYGQWHPGCADASEKTVGKWIRSRGVEKEIFLITKGAHPDPVTGKTSRFSKEEIHGDFYRSLEVMGLDRVDLYFLHRDDESLPVSGIMDAMNELVQKGQARAIGASNWRAARIAQANTWAASQGKALFTATQLQWSYADYAPACQDPTLVLMDEGEMAAYEKMPDISVMAYTSQAEGIFSKGYLPDLSNVQPRHQRYVTDENIRRYQALLDRCSREKGMTPTRVMLEYIVRHPRLPGFALIGASNLDQLNDSMNAI